MVHEKMRYYRIGFKQTKTGNCSVCEKKAKRIEEFYQTISPWNQKTPGQIMEEEKIKAHIWAKMPVKHAKCERKGGIICQ